MPLKTETIDLLEEHARLDQRLDDLADRGADMVGSYDEFLERVEEADEDASGIMGEVVETDRHLAGVQWALDHKAWPDDPSVTIGALTTGEKHAVETTAARFEEEKQMLGDDMSDMGSEQTIYIAAGVIDGPFVPHDEGDPQNDIIDLVQVIDDTLHPQFSSWLGSRIDKLTSVDRGNVKSFGERLKERLPDEDAPPASSSQRPS